MDRRYQHGPSSNNGVHIRIQGRRNMDRESSPIISVRRFGHTRTGPATTLLNQPPPLSRKQFEGTPIRINHIITDSPPLSPTSTPNYSRKSPTSGAMPPRITVRQRPVGYPLGESFFARDRDDAFASKFQRLKNTIFSQIPVDGMDFNDSMFDCMEKEFDKFTRESRSFSRDGDWPSSSRSRGTDWDDFTKSDWDLPGGAKEIRINTTKITAADPKSTGSNEKGTARKSASSSSSKASSVKQEASAAVTKAKKVLDQVLRDLVSKDDTESGYSGSGDFAEAGKSTIQPEELTDRIKVFNETQSNKKMARVPSRDDDDAFRGEIEVNICLEKPVNILLQQNFSEKQDNATSQDRVSDGIKASVTLPKDTVTTVNAHSSDTAADVIKILTRKFNILDDWQSFALYEQSEKSDEELKLKKVSTAERPLVNYLKWMTTPNAGREHRKAITRRLVFRENDSEQILWEAFSVPELCNFLKMLELEHQKHIDMIKLKFESTKRQLKTKLSEMKPSGDVT